MSNYITLQDGIRLSGPKTFTAMTKPAGSLCNLHCHYCYYLDKGRFYGAQQKVMPQDVLERYIKEYIAANEVPQVSFLWHGGEPLLAGLDFFQKVVAYQRQYNTKGKKIENALQTNGTLLTPQWCQFFKKNNFLVGLSLDGPMDLHNAYRRNKAGAPSFEKTLRGLELLKRYNVDFNTLTVVNRNSEGRGREIYRFLKSKGVQFMQFLPAVDYINPQDTYGDRAVIASPLQLTSASELAPWSVSAPGYGQFLVDVFNEWVVQDVGRIFVQLFDQTLSAWCGIEPSLCAYREVCGQVLAVEHNGDVYCCDHFVYPEHLLGNITRQSLEEMRASTQLLQFGLNKRNTLSRQCLRCPYYFACRGECPKHRHTPTADGEKKFSLCEGLLQFYKHSEPYMKYMRDLLKMELPPAQVMPWAATILGR